MSEAVDTLGTLEQALHALQSQAEANIIAPDAAFTRFMEIKFQAHESVAQLEPGEQANSFMQQLAEAEQWFRGRR